jgi:curli biogenesis system outer membrane secretion channel CsgG
MKKATNRFVNYLAPFALVFVLTLALQQPSYVNAQESGEGAKQTVVAVSRFTNSTGKPLEVGIGLADKLNLALDRTQRFTIVERLRLEDVMTEQHLELSGLVDPSTAKEVGKLLGIDYLVVGNLHQFNFVENSVPIGGLFGAITGNRSADGFGMTSFQVDVAVAVSFIDVETGEQIIAQGAGHRSGSGVGFDIHNPRGIAWGQINRGAIGEAIDVAINDAVRNAKTKLFAPTILKRTGDEVFFDMGAADSVLVGEVFTVIVKEELPGGHAIEDKVGEISVTKVYDTVSRALILYGLDKVEPGMMVRRKAPPPPR